MNLKKMLISLIMIMLIALTAMQNTTLAKETLTEGKEVYFGIRELMENSVPHMGYSINNPDNANSEKIWNIVRYKTGTPSDGYDNVNLYCLKAKVGFTDSSNGLISPYNVNYKMKTEKEDIKKQNEILKGLVEGTITEDGKTISIYNALLAVLDMMYLPGESTEEEKVELVKASNKYAYDSGDRDGWLDYVYPSYYPEEEEYKLTDNDINAIQQAVIWYFSNYGEDDGIFDRTLDSYSWIWYTEDGDTYDHLLSYNPNNVGNGIPGEIRAMQARLLYNYMIDKAKENASKYENIVSGSPIRVDTEETLQSEISGNDCIIGPIHMTQINTNGYTVKLTVKNNGSEISNYKLLNENKRVTTASVKSLVGSDFYISVPKDQVDRITVDVDVDYNERNPNLWASTKNNQEQPIAEIKNTKTSVHVKTMILEKEKSFDLALRKYITKINNGPELSGGNSRVPNIDEASLQTGTTATYKHKKDPVEVATGDKVTYKLTIYNEGEKIGRATKIVDQLPTGLQFTRVVSGNFELDTYNESTNTLKLKRKSGNTTNLPAYSEGNLRNNGRGSETIEIECTVTASADTLSDKVLTNVAWIEEQYDAEANVTITNQEGLDRDSEPTNKPSVNKDNMTNYKGNDSNQTNLNDSNYYYKGQQDDDDFEKLILKGKPMDLALRKYITKINDGPELSGNDSRVPNIDEASLQTGTTATYKHKKDPVEVATGDKVTYKLTIYNEGQKAGRATKIVDQLPTGLQFTRVVSGNFELDNYNESTNTLNLKRKSGNTTNLPAYTAGNLRNNGRGSETIEIECTVTGVQDPLNNKILTNVAWIGEQYDAEANVTITNQEGADRDSKPSSKPNVNKDNMENYKGNDNNSNDLTNSNYYYEGQQDDDDFEKLVLKAKPMDLALRKYITKINDGPELSGNNSRVPNIDEASLQTGTTANYKHKKDPVEVATGDKVTYKLTIYNEGQKVGRATKIVDQLPTGLQFTRVVSGNFELDNYNESTNTLNLKRKSGNTTNLPAYTAGNLRNNGRGSETIEIECTVTGKQDPLNDKILTNVAWIGEQYDAEANVTVTNQEGVDRDSEPSSRPNVNKDNMENYKGNNNNPNDLTNKDYYYEGQQDDDDFEKLILKGKPMDLALRKYITKINDGPELSGDSSRVPNIDEGTLASGTTAVYKHRKDPVVIASGDRVTYKLTIYNEGQKVGRATKIVDQLPTGLQFTRVVSGNFELDSYNESTNTLNLKRKSGNTTNLPAYTTGNLTNNGKGSETIEIECKVVEKADEEKSKILTNVAWIGEQYDAEADVTITNQEGADRDSEPTTIPNVSKDNMSDYKGNNSNPDELDNKDHYYEGKQDDDDFEKLVILPEAFDLKLIKRITAVNDEPVEERIENIDASKLNTLDDDKNMITTADYELNKEPVAVKKGDIVTYTFRIYNEGTIDGYAKEISEDVPEGLEFVWSEKEGEELKNDNTLTEEEKEAIEFNQNYLWGNFKYDENGEKIITISSEYLSKENETTVGGNLIKAFGRNDGTKTDKDLSYKELSVKFKVTSEEKSGTIIKNEAAITEDTDKEEEPVDDRDSHPEEWEEDPDHEDDEDHDFVTLQSFDLALRKFIIAISNDTKIDNNEYLKNQDGSYKRAPVVDTSKLNTIDEEGKMITTATYNHTKEPVFVKQKDIVVYMLRVYNEGDISGYAAEINDYLPEDLEFVDSEFNKEYGWEVSEDGRKVTTKYLENALIEKAKEDEEGNIELSYKEVPIMCQVKENAKTSQNITNTAEITKYLDENKKPTTDRDSQEKNMKVPEDKDLPGYKDDETGSYVPGQQDDDDFEKVVVKIFDLALRKWVTQAIVIENGKETVSQTGHKPWDELEAVVKVELNRKKLNQVTVKFRYSIRVYNQGELEGYAKEVTDYIPEGLKFVAQDNPDWKDEGNNVISTRKLENTLLRPGEYADVEVLLTWINNENNMGLKVNTAEISEDYNEYDVPDKDSEPNNKTPKEDDIDDAPVMLSITTGQIRIYFALGFIVLITAAGGVVLIKKFVL